MKQIYLFTVLLLIVLSAVGCSFNIQDMGIPFIPTSTYTPLPPPPATPTPTYPPKSAHSNDLLQTEILDTDATLLTDRELGYQALFSPEWFVVIMDSTLEEQLKAAFGESVPNEIRDLLNTSSKLGAARIVALDYTYKYSFRSPAFITLTYSTDPDALETEMNDVLAQNIEAAPTLMPGSDVIYQNVQTNSHGVEYGKLLINQQSETYGVRIKKEIALFKVSDGLLILTGSASEDDYATLELVFQKVIDSIQLDQ